MTQAATREDVQASAVRLYAEGWSIREIATVHLRAYGTVRRMLLDAGVELRPRGGQRVKP